MEAVELMECFQHFSYDVSNRTLICCDLQGVREGKKFILTDPAINSIEQKYGNTDIGKLGINAIINSHRCSRMCLLMGLSKMGSPPSLSDLLMLSIGKNCTIRRSHTSGI